MNQKKIAIIIPSLAALVWLGFVGGRYIYQSSVPSDKAMPGTHPLKDESDAIAVARTIAGFDSTNHDPSSLTFISVKFISPTEFVRSQNSNGVRANPSFFINVASELVSSKLIYIVTFQGSFRPSHHPPGVEPPVFPFMNVILDSRDGSVIGIQMHR